MDHRFTGNLLMVSNYPSDTAYAWWLMEHFWKIQSELFQNDNRQAYLAYPQITTLSNNIKNASVLPIELTIPWRTPQEASQAKEFILKNNIRYIYFTDQTYFSPLYITLRRLGVKRIVIHDHTPGDRPAVNGLKGFIKAMINRLPGVTADTVICVSELMRQRNIANSRLPKNKCTIVQNGIPPIACHQTDRARGLRSSLNIDAKSTLVITSGRAHPYKRFDFVIKCAAKLRELAPNLKVEFLLVGDGPAMDELKQLVHKLNLSECVHLLGFRNDVHDLLCISDLALHAALGEGFSLSIIEYMSAGLPVLVPDIPSVCQSITHGKTGIIYPRDDIEFVASRIKSLVINSKERTTMGDAAKEVADSLYTLDRCTQQFKQNITKAYT